MEAERRAGWNFVINNWKGRLEVMGGGQVIGV